ncbi:MAG: hypothetical protein J7605_02415 [Variovorax sp.]|nr:hypothetical protein [Variovorax sp.]
MRNAGRWLTWNQKPREVTGQLMTSRVTKDDAVMAAISILHGPELYDPKIKAIGGNEMTIVGLERVDFCWCLQEWKCEILKL